ncbi:MAG TPA: hypothetical protein G4O13_07460 [Dehalococcoidia bacterium]|nr:hypothetical protein [Dehalococcoidia bacterium]
MTMDPKNVDLVAALLVMPLVEKLVDPEAGNIDHERKVIVDNYFAMRHLLLEEEMLRQTQRG